MDQVSQQRGPDRYDPQRRIVRLPDGTIYAHKPVWTVRVAVLRAGCRADNASVIWGLFAFIGLVFLLASLFFLLFGIYELSGPEDYLAFTVLLAGVSLMLYLVIRLLCGALIAHVYRETSGWLYGSDLGRLLADENWHALIRNGVEARPWLKSMLPPAPRSFEQQLEFAAVYGRLLWGISTKPAARLGGLPATALHHLTSTRCGLPAVLACCLLSPFAWLPGLLAFPLVVCAIAASALTRRTRLIAICDFLLEEVDEACTRGWRMPVVPVIQAGPGRPTERTAADIMRDAARDAARKGTRQQE